MSDANRKFYFYRGEKLVGTVTIVDINQPYFCGHIEPAEAFAEIEPLLERLAQNRRQRSSHDLAGVSAEKREARQRSRNEYEQIVQEFIGPGLRMVDALSGELVYEPLDLEVDERGFWWNGHIWKDGRRII